MAKVLVVDDEAALRDALSYTLGREGYAVASAADGPTAIERAADFGPDLVILDVMLPGFDGLEVCRQLRSRSNVPVILLTARDGTRDQVAGLDVGADDYVTKPFNVRELLARVAAVLRRCGKAKQLLEEDQALLRRIESHVARVRTPARAISSPQTGALRSGDLSLDLDRCRATLRDAPLALAEAEYHVLRLLLANPGRVVTRTELLERVFGGDQAHMPLLEATVRCLHDKLGDDPTAPRFVQTVPGIGYSWKGRIA